MKYIQELEEFSHGFVSSRCFTLVVRGWQQSVRRQHNLHDSVSLISTVMRCAAVLALPHPIPQLLEYYISVFSTSPQEYKHPTINSSSDGGQSC